jgi:mRNA-decapping enzyme subunit 2
MVPPFSFPNSNYIPQYELTLYDSRFIVNIPSEELESVPRICFQIEQAHWYYEDFVREQNPHRLPSLSLRKFSKCIFDHCPLLWEYSGSHEEEFEDFLRYKQRVPVLGGILLDENWEKVSFHPNTILHGD